jgi:hypothetical protein
LSSAKSMSLKKQSVESRMYSGLIIPSKD